MSRRAKSDDKPRQRIPQLRLAGFAVLLFSLFSLLPGVMANPRMEASFLGASGGLLALLFILRHRVSRDARVLRYEFVPRPVQYVQLVMHTTLYAYWGWYWREVYHHIPLILAQIVFVYALDMMVCWWRRDAWVLGFGPFPIVLSTNLFLWFKDDWWFLQFLLVATGVLAKEFLTWKRENRRVHIFNPSAIGLALFSVILLATGTTHISWAEQVAVTLGRPPQIYVVIFLLGLVVQSLFSVTLVTLSAAATLYLLNLAYTHATGVYYFVDSNIPGAVFLGLHLLVTDPATSPRRSFAKLLFGAMYGAAVFGLYWLLGSLGMPTFYDKLLCVPPLNLTVRALDRLDRAFAARLVAYRWPPLEWIGALSPRQANFAHMGVWITMFIIMIGTGFLGGRHPGANPEFWLKACEDGRRNACRTLVDTLGISCQHGSAQACFSAALLLDEGRRVPRDLTEAAKDFGRACDLQMSIGCRELVEKVRTAGPEILRPSCDRGDGESCFLLASLYYAGRGVPKDYGRAVALFRRSCESGWPRGCGGLAECYRAGQGTPPDPAQAVEYFERACRADVAPSCYAVATMYRDRREEDLARQRFRQACDSSTRVAQTNAAYFRTAGVRPAPALEFCSDLHP
jgi:hypothetical protein